MENGETRRALSDLLEAYVVGDVVRTQPEDGTSAGSGASWGWSLVGLAAAMGLAAYTYRRYDRKLGQLVDSLIVERRRNGHPSHKTPAQRRRTQVPVPH